MKISYHDLRQYALAHFQQKAGYIPPQMPLDYSWVNELTCTVITSVKMYSTPKTDVYWTTVYLDTTCWDCLTRIRKLNLLPHNTTNLYIGSQLGDWQICELCGNLGIETQLPY